MMQHPQCPVPPRTSLPSTRVVSLPPDAAKMISSPLRKRASSNWRVKSLRALSSPACQAGQVQQERARLHALAAHTPLALEGKLSTSMQL